MEKKHKSRITAGILGLFLGVFGAQRFYLGSWLGIIFILMLFVSPMLAAIAGMIDGLFFLLMSDEQFDHNFNSGKSVERRVNRRNRGRRANQNSKQKNIRQQRRRKMNRPKNNPYKLSGQRKLQDYDLSGAIEDFNQGLKLDDEDKDIHYNLAKAHSLSENKELGFKTPFAGRSIWLFGSRWSCWR